MEKSTKKPAFLRCEVLQGVTFCCMPSKHGVQGVASSNLAVPTNFASTDAKLANGLRLGQTARSNSYSKKAELPTARKPGRASEPSFVGRKASRQERKNLSSEHR